MVNYQLGKIYKITSPHTDLIYIGSTAQELLCMRFSAHLVLYRSYLKGKTNFCSSFELLKFSDCKIELIETYPCNNRDELCAKEGEWVRKLDCVNKNIAGRSINEWRVENKEYTKEYHKKWFQDNGNIKITCECGCKISKSNIAKHRTSKKHINFVKQSI